jgi:iron complex outermembrane receptor protein
MSPRSARIALALSATASILALGSAPSVRAQSDQPAAAGGGNGMEEIVVTARRKEERVQSVPIAITAFNQNDLDKKQIQTVQDLSRAVPSLAVSNSQSDANAPYSSQTRLRGLPGTVIYFSDVPLGTADYQAGTGLTHGLSAGFYFDLDNLEVLKGPQGTLFGKNSIGGLISIEPKKPTNNYEGYAEVKFGNYGDKEYDAAVNIPIIKDKLLVRIAGEGQQRDGYTKDFYTGKDYDNRDYYSWRVGVTLRPTDDIENYFVYDGYWQDQNGSSTIARFVNPNFVLVPHAYQADPRLSFLKALGITGPLTIGTGPSLSGLSTDFGGTIAAAKAVNAFSAFPDITQAVAQQAQLGARTELGHSVQGIGKDYFYGFTDTATWDVLDNLTIKNIASARVFKQLSTTDDFGAGNIPLLNIGVPGNQVQWGDNSIQYTEELQFQGKSLNDKLSWVVGGYLEYDGPLGDTLLGSTAVGNPSFYHFTTTARSQAVFAHGIYDLSDYVEGLRFTAGYRYTWDHVTAEERGTNGVDAVLRNAAGAATNCSPVVAVDNNCHVSAGGNFSSYGWNLGLDEQLTKDVLIYVRSGNAYRPGGFNLNVPVSNEKFQPEHVTDVEIGTKADWDWMGVHGRTNFDLYHTDYKAIQVQELVSVTDSQGNTHVNSLYANAATATLEGGELETTIEPYTGVEISPHASYIYATYDKYPTAFGAVSAHPPFLYLPKWQYAVTGTYHLPLDESIGDVAVSATYSWYGHQYLSNNVGEIYPIMPSYENLDLRVDWTNALEYPVDLGFFMSNAMDNTHVVGGFPIYAQLGFTSLVYNQPRMYGFSVKYRFQPPAAEETVPEAYTPPPVQAPQPVARSYMVFFDFNKSDLTPDAVKIVDQAAANAAPAKATTLTVTGHTDTVGSDAYNMRLGKRRAESVAAQLEKDGIPSSEIVLISKGKRDLLVPTKDGVREPQNRRVTIVYDGGPTS